MWTIVGLARDLERDAPLAMRVAGERGVFLRDAAGKPCALLDRRPHRGVALSFDKRLFVQCSNLGLDLLNAGWLPGSSVAVLCRKEAAAP